MGVDNGLDQTIDKLAQQLGQLLKSNGQRIATAESCTGGGIAEAITRIAGSSQWFEYGWVTYANAAKQQELGVSSDTLAQVGAVSAAVVEQMATGAAQQAGADMAVAVSGIAGPDGGSAEKPVGTVWLGWVFRQQAGSRCLHLNGSRRSIRQQTVVAALMQAIELAQPTR